MKPLKELDYDNISRTQLAAMKRQILNPSQPKFTGKIFGSSWNRIPAVSNVEIQTQDFNAYLLEIGIQHKLPPKMKFERNRNHRMNRYIGHQILRMRNAKQAGNGRLFGIVSTFCLKSSVSFRLSAINHIKPNGWFGLSADRIHQINRRVNVILAKMTPRINFRRVYIPKPGNRGRPLGVPSDEWRVALHMLNNMLVLGFEEAVLDCQHAYIPGRGCMTAGRQIIQEVIHSNFIYETDLKGFFDNVSIFKINNILRQGDVPTDLRIGIHNMSKSLPKLPKDKKLPEDKYESGDPRDRVHIREEFIHEFLTRPDGPMVLSQPLDDVTRNLAIDIIEKKGLLPEYFLGFANRNAQAPGGVPQGSPMSPFLAILAVRDYLKQVGCVNYADDQIFHANEPFVIKDAPEMGIIHNKEKCGWIRKNGEWLKELKFLGLIYNPGTGKLRSETRSGRAERIKDSLLELLEDLDYDKDENYLERLVQRNVFGFALSCLYNGTGNQERIATKDRVVHKKSILGRYVNSRTLSSALLDVLSANLNLRKGTRSVDKRSKKPEIKEIPPSRLADSKLSAAGQPNFPWQPKL